MWMTIATALTALIAVLHGYFMWLEMCGWTRPAGRRAFGLTIEFAEQTRRLAANQGLYNGFLAAGLVWSLWPGSPAGLFSKLNGQAKSAPACRARPSTHFQPHKIAVQHGNQGGQGGGDCHPHGVVSSVVM
jgi:hypothetical protein